MKNGRKMEEKFLLKFRVSFTEILRNSLKNRAEILKKISGNFSKNRGEIFTEILRNSSKNRG